MSLINILTKLNDKIIDFLGTPIIKYGFLILIILQIIFIKNINTYYLQIFDNNLFKIIYAFLIAYYACFDPIYAIALTTLMIISIQEIHSRNATYNSNSLMPKLKLNNMLTSDSKSINNLSLTSNTMSAKIFDNDELVYELINKHSLQKQPDVNDKLTAEYKFCQEPAYQTITDNVCKSNLNHELENVDQNKSIQGLEGEIFNIQGLPNGYEPNKQNISSL